MALIVTPEEIAAANEAQLRSVQYSHGMWVTNQCEVCDSKEHGTHYCCERCNYDRHLCHYCGDNLGHDEVSACYILIKLEEKRGG